MALTIPWTRISQNSERPMRVLIDSQTIKGPMAVVKLEKGPAKELKKNGLKTTLMMMATMKTMIKWKARAKRKKMMMSFCQ
jgi:hypothetical protein